MNYLQAYYKEWDAKSRGTLLNEFSDLQGNPKQGHKRTLLWHYFKKRFGEDVWPPSDREISKLLQKG